MSPSRAKASTGAAPNSSPSNSAPSSYKIDVVQTVHVSSDAPLSSTALERIKTQVQTAVRRELDGYVTADDGNVQIARTRLSSVGGKGQMGARDRTISSAPASPPFLPTSTPAPARSGKATHTNSPQPTAQPQSQSRSQPQRILFYHAHDPHYGFTNFSPDPVTYQGKVYPTSEHLFQSLKFLPHRPELAEHMRTCSSRPRTVFDEAHRFSPEVRPDWLKVRIDMMDLALWLKFTQNAHLKAELLQTGKAELVEDSDKDAFWGVGPDGKGENQLGKALQRLRARLQDDAQTSRGKAVLSKSPYR